MLKRQMAAVQHQPRIRPVHHPLKIPRSTRNIPRRRVLTNLTSPLIKNTNAKGAANPSPVATYQQRRHLKTLNHNRKRSTTIYIGKNGRGKRESVERKEREGNRIYNREAVSLRKERPNRITNVRRIITNLTIRGHHTRHTTRNRRTTTDTIARLYRDLQRPVPVPLRHRQCHIRHPSLSHSRSRNLRKCRKERDRLHCFHPKMRRRPLPRRPLRLAVRNRSLSRNLNLHRNRNPNLRPSPNHNHNLSNHKDQSQKYDNQRNSLVQRRGRIQVLQSERCSHLQSYRPSLPLRRKNSPNQGKG